MRELREDQSDALNLLRASVARGNRRIIVKASTGWGKTIFASQLVANARAKNKKLLFTVPAIDLVDQTVEKFYDQGVTDIGVIQANHEMTDWAQPVQVASVQTLKRRKLPQADLVLVDEIHKWHRFYEDWFFAEKGKPYERWKNIPIIGLSATPWTKGLGAYFDDLIIAATTQELIDAGLLSQFRVFAPDHPDLSSVRTVAGDYVEDELARVMGDNKLVADIVKTWLEKGRGRPTICFAVNRDHAALLVERFEQAGVKVAYQDAFTKKDERRAIARKSQSGDVEVVVNIATLTTGVDWPWLRCIVLARPTKSEMLFVQMIGRGLRTDEGKDYCLILDHSDTHLRMGFVTDVDAKHTGLNNGKTNPGIDKDLEAKIRLPKECPSCGALKLGAKCLACGFQAEHVVSPEEKLKEGSGELAELKQKKKDNKSWSESQKAQFLAELMTYGRQKGYQDGWASNKYRERFGVWPNRYGHVVPAKEISVDTASWIRHTQIKWAKSKKRQPNNQALAA